MSRPAPDIAFRVKLAREALAAYEEWDADDSRRDGWGEIMGSLAGALELLLPLVGGKDGQHSVVTTTERTSA